MTDTPLLLPWGSGALGRPTERKISRFPWSSSKMLDNALIVGTYWFSSLCHLYKRLREPYLVFLGSQSFILKLLMTKPDSLFLSCYMALNITDWWYMSDSNQGCFNPRHFFCSSQWVLQWVVEWLKSLEKIEILIHIFSIGRKHSNAITNWCDANL